MAPTALFAQQAERHQLGGSDVAIYNLAGRVRMDTGSGDEVTVEVLRGGRDASRLRVESGSVRGRETVRVVYPGDHIVYAGGGRRHRTDVRVRDDGTFGEGWDAGRRVRITDGGDGLEAHADLRVTVPRGKRVALYLAAGDADVANVEGEIRVDVWSASIRTRGTRGTLHLDTGSGSVEVQGADGDIDLDTGSGDVKVVGVRGSRLRIDTGSGGVSATDVEAENLDVDVGSGRIDLMNVRCPEIRLDTGSGHVNIGLAAAIKSLRIDSGSGGITVRIPASVGAEIEVDTGSGGIRTEIPVQVTRASRSKLIGRIGDGAGRIKIDTGSGGVRLVRG